MKELTQKEKLILNEWKDRRANYEKEKQALKSMLSKYGAASREFDAARVEFEMIKEEFDNFEKEHIEIISPYR